MARPGTGRGPIGMARDMIDDRTDYGGARPSTGRGPIGMARERLEPTSGDKLHSGNADTMNAELIRLARDDYETTYQPSEREVLRTLRDGNQIAEREADRAGRTARTQAGITRGEFNRTLSRGGVNTTAEMDKSVGRSQGLSKARSVATAENLTRGAYKELHTDAKGDMLSIGRNIQSGALSAGATAANAHNAREAANDAADTARTQNMISSAMTGAGIAAAAGTSIAAGAGWGLLAAFI